MTLYHYTCDCGLAALGRRGIIKPMSQWHPQALPFLKEWQALGYISWFTDLDTPVARALGLTRKQIRCDRTEFRYRVEDSSIADIVPWIGSEYRRLHPELRELELVRGVLPMHWYISTHPILASLDA
jgi:hypothetical protein